jgi:hypothetical protein
MSLGGILFFLLLLALVSMIVVTPLLSRSRITRDQDLRLEKQRDRLRIYYERVLGNLRDLDEDHATGKMPDDLYNDEREAWMQRGVEVLKALDGLEQESMIPPTTLDDAALDEAIDSAIESAIASYRSSS